MGLFDKWKPKNGLVEDKDKINQEIRQIGDNAVNAVNAEVDNLSAPGLQRQGFDLDLASVGTLNPYENQNGISTSNGQIKKNPATVGLSPEDVTKGLNAELPQAKIDANIQNTPSKVDLSTLEGADLLGGLAPMSEEERMRNAQRAQAVSGIAHFGNALAALGNVFAVGAGAPSQTNPQLQSPDIEGYLERGRQQRMQYAQMKRAMQTQDREQARRDAELKIKEDAAKRKADLEEVLAPYKANEAMFKAKAAEYGATKAEAEALYKELEAKNAPTKFELENDALRARKGSYQASAAASTATANLRNTEARQKSDANYEYFYSDNDGEIKVDKKKIGNKANLAKIHALTGEKSTKEASNGYGTVSKTTDDMLADIGRHINDPKVAKALKDLQSGKASAKEEEIDY